MKNLTIKARLIAAIAFLTVLLAAIGFAGLNSLSRTNASLQTVYDDRLVAMGMLNQIGTGLLYQQIALGNAVDAQDGGHSTLLAQAQQRGGEIDKVWAAYMATYLTPDEAVLAKAFAASHAAMREQAMQPMAAALAAGERERAAELQHKKLDPAMAAADHALEALVALQLAVGKQEYADSQARYSTFRAISIASIVLGVAVGAVMGYWLLRAILVPLRGAIGVAEAVAAGDLTQRIEVSSNDEMGQLTAALKRMNDSLATIVAQVRQGTETITVASGEIASGNADLSSRTETQASSLEETASSMEELTSTVQHNTESARAADTLAHEAAAVAQRGGAVVAQVVATMGAINQSSNKIADIIGTIDGIAFQTNILALNAAVEAARAGEQGRGFAVVASEVRNLAQRSAAAAKEIKELIGDSVAHVGAGSKLVDQAGATMQEVVTSVERVTGMMSSILSASVEQSSGIEQINQAVAEMDTVTQQNAALVEQAAAAAESLQDQARTLEQAVSVFKLDAGALRTAARSAPAAAARPAQGGRPAVRPALQPARAALAQPGKGGAKPAARSPAQATAAPRHLKAVPAATDGDWEEF
ncbi:methyl-accepting chemotaxis protein [Massilia sp. Root351]|jgi:methyl-accepting chemotaxis protein-1 (serine sensor receptor)|uniref:methyl-accepting chemotaxis protein n=1 Tax=Massilia sp. Root351 TaxID=1736522 RepID=UPI0009EBCFE7|nr:methyl-accepting chemotaxis protein [Massilia sp. Root351]